jgi:prepilin-type N-terminal cleavage/methylation domain-containing protein
MKRGFGLLEVLVAAVVLAFLLVGLNLLQKGNRESILRVRARDGANEVAQDIIDSISALGSASVKAGTCDVNGTDDERALCRERTFTGNVTVLYSVTVDVKAPLQVVNEETDFIKAGGGNGLTVEHKLSKQVDVTVKWKFKNSNPSIEVSALVR